MTVTSFSIIALAAAVAPTTGQWLAAAVATAMQRAQISQDYVSRVTEIPPNKLSEQLGAKTPFTGFRLLDHPEIWTQTDFWDEFANVLAEKVECALVPRDLGHVLERLDRLDAALSHIPKRMLKATSRARTASHAPDTAQKAEAR